MPTRKILHITPHLGGGVGRVLLNYLRAERGNKAFTHEVRCLDYANPEAARAAAAMGLPLKDNMGLRLKKLLEEIGAADLVLIHWWNHPQLFDLLVRGSFPPARILIWSHISGLHPPYGFTKPALNFPDFFVFTTPASFGTGAVKARRAALGDKLQVVWSTGGVEHLAAIKPRAHKKFRIGYIGTVDYCKMHPDFVAMSAAAKIPDSEFVVCGGPAEAGIARDARELAPSARFVFTGQVREIAPYLETFDVFGYPLAPYHYGTCEQALCEAMAAGVPPVVLGNRAERHIIKDGVTGLIARNPGEYSRALKKLWLNKELRKKIGANARREAFKIFSMAKMASSWEGLFEKALRLPKTARTWKGEFSGAKAFPAALFLEAVGPAGRFFRSSMRAFYKHDLAAARKLAVKGFSQSRLWLAQTRGTPSHYSAFYRKDKCLAFWKEISAELNKPA